MKNKPKAPSKTKIPKETLVTLGNRIKALRLKAGFTSYEHFAYEHNFSRAQFGRYESGEDLRYTSLVKVVAAFGLTLEEFFSEGFD
ncbi:MAG: transcriptional regulator [Bacteroidetes bacterium RIFCSPLOWO2_12_FULL_35_15]|nr:MAG: transcriptional regulator [Bacteroidetes bacterium RIFCSPLOWO2_12_FULL_35_15]